MDSKTRLILHIGQGKTGSTSIQNALRKNAGAVAAAGILYPETGQHTNHQDIFTYLTGDVKHHDPRLGGARDDRRKIELGKTYWRSALDRIAAERPRLVVLSCENQFRPFAPEALARLNAEIAGRFSDVLVTAYLRDPASHFLSMAQQDIKKRPDFAIPSRSAFRDTLEPWRAHGPGPAEAILFSRESLKDGDVVADFFARYLSLDSAALAVAGSEDNTTMSAEAMAVLQDFQRGSIAAPERHYANRPQRMKDLVQAADVSVPGFAKPRLRVGLAEAIVARATDLDWLAQTFGIRFPDFEQGDMDGEAADARITALDTVADLCPVDPERKAALLQEIARAAAESRSLGRTLRAWMGR